VTSADGVRSVDDVEVVMAGEMSLSNHRGTAHTHTHITDAINNRSQAHLPQSTQWTLTF